jgi:hypothetical protein
MVSIGIVEITDKRKPEPMAEELRMALQELLRKACAWRPAPAAHGAFAWRRASAAHASPGGGPVLRKASACGRAVLRKGFCLAASLRGSDWRGAAQASAWRGPVCVSVRVAAGPCA